MDMKSIGQGAKQIVALLLGGLVVLFAVVNMEAVAVNLLYTQVELSLSLLILVSALAGTSIGWTGAALRGRRKRKALRAGSIAELEASAEDEEWLAEELEDEPAPGND